jgi:MFS transporter, SP family, sugar:H+ symporter
MLNPKDGNMGLNVGYFYLGRFQIPVCSVEAPSADERLGVTSVVWILVFLFVPETASLTSEQIDDYFLAGWRAWRTSTARNKKIASGEDFSERRYGKSDP